MATFGFTIGHDGQLAGRNACPKCERLDAGILSRE
jgi:hypothetical protein